MRKDLLGVVLFLLLGVLVAYYLFGGNHVLFSAARGTIPMPAEFGGDSPSDSHVEAKSRSAAPKNSLATRAEGKNGGKSRDIPLAQQGSSRRLTPACCELPFPTPETLKPGLTVAELRAVYGDPALDVARTDAGRVTEKLYFVNGKRTLLTIAVMENGRLKSAESQPGGMLPLPKAVGDSR